MQLRTLAEPPNGRVRTGADTWTPRGGGKFPRAGFRRQVTHETKVMEVMKGRMRALARRALAYITSITFITYVTISPAKKTRAKKNPELFGSGQRSGLSEG